MIYKYEIIETDRADYKFNVQIWTSIDAGRTFNYCGNGRFFKSYNDCETYINSQLKNKRNES